MYLKKIIANGFKSFADKTEIIVEDGMTAIVGPNGSGKSNISDSIKWVLGEQSPKSLRGSKMEDIIFAGTQKRLPLGYADVELIFDNTRGEKLPVDYKTVSVKRRLYRTGESEYSVNGKSCRLKDIKELFMDTGIGKDGYSIIGQGKVEEILSPNSQIRRGVFEEAAGIVKFKVRKDEALRKISKTDDNIDRVNDIIAELEGRIKPLEKQSKKALKYLELREELKLVELNMFVRDYEKSKESLAILNAQSDSTDVKKKEKIEKRTRLEGIIKEEKENSDLMKSNLEYISGENKTLEEKKNSFENMISVYSEKISLHTSNMNNTEEEIKGLEDKVNTVDSEKKAFKNQREDKKALLLNKKDECEKYNLEIIDFKIKLDSADHMSEEKKSELLGLHTKISEINSEINSSRSIKENFEENTDKLNSEIEEEKVEYDIKNSELENFKTEKETSNKEIEKLNKTKEASIAKRENLLIDRKEIQDKKQQYMNKLSILKSKKVFLDGLENDYEGYYRSVQTLMSKFKNEGKFKGSIFGTVADIIKTDSKYETAIEIALGGAIQNVIVNNNQDADYIIKYLKENKIGRVTFLPINSVAKRSLRNQELQYLDEMGVIGTADELIDNDSLFDSVVKNLLGRTIIVENIRDGFRVAKKCNNSIKIVSLDGDVINPGGAITGGHIAGKSHGILSRKREIEEIKSAYAVMEKKCSDVDEDARDIERDLTVSQRIATNSVKELEEYRNFILKLDNSILFKKQEIQKLELEIYKHKEDYEHQNSENILRAKKIEILEIDREKVSVLIKTMADDIDDIKNSSDVEKAKLEEMNSILADKNFEISEIKQDIRMFEEKINSDNRLIEENRVQIEKKKENLNISDSEVESAKKEIESLSTNLREMIIQLNKQYDKINEFNEEILRKTKYLDETQINLNELNAKLSDSTDEEYNLRIKIERITAKLENLASKIWEDYEMNYAMALEYKNEEISFTKLSQNVSQYKREIKNLGEINILSVEEFKEVKKRFDFLCKQKEDLEDAKKQLKEVIETLDKDMVEMFLEEFSRTREEFREVFSELFIGGKADVFLVDENDVLNSEIEIVAQPPGKKFTKISLLSGGEKSLTAIALLFSILKTKPTSFCILDEIDSALDDVNVHRFAMYLREFAEHTQFLCISHRKGTMESADTLYGTMMEEKGVTKLVSLRLNDLKGNKFVE